MIFTWYFYDRSPLLTNGYHCWQIPSFEPLSKFEPNPFISLQVTVSESNQPPNFLQRWKKVNFVCWLNTTFCVEKPYQKPTPSSMNNSAPSYGIVQNWFTKFRCGLTSTETIPSPGRPNEITTPEIINKIHDIVLNDPKVKMRKIAEFVSISTERVVNILDTHLCIRQLCARWLPRLLTIDQKRIRAHGEK